MSNFVVSARKYRPVRFDEVVGQQHVSQTLKNALQNDQLAHAFLFCGPRGVGKTTCARILAKVLNCENVTTDFEACNECRSCKSFNENASFNITELDAASNNSVEHIRALIEQVRFQPQQGQYKIFIIDEVHMLSQQAFNAFLKTLEEPPPYAIFILATTEKHKIIPTILSRCQIFDFRRIQVKDIVGHLQGICEKEGIQADKDALHIIAQKADGALRDALSIFDRITSSLVAQDGKKRISYEHVIENLNVLDYDYYFRIIDAMLLEDVSEVLVIFDDILKKGFEADIFINGLADHIRNILVAKDTSTLQLLEVSDGLRDRYLQQAKAAPSTFMLTALNLANDCDINYKMARNKRLHVEITIIKMTYINRALHMVRNPILTVSPSTSPEKKTPEVSAKEDETSSGVSTKLGSKVESVVESEKEQPGNEENIPVPATADESTNINNNLSSSTVKKEVAAPAINLKTDHDLPSLTSLEALEEALEEESQQEKSPAEELTINKLQPHWKKYIEMVESPSLKSTLKRAELELEGVQLRIKVGSKINRELIQQESGLMRYLRNQLKRN
jgi:DNA polymerase-3 subunit gamma/tau